MKRARLAALVVLVLLLVVIAGALGVRHYLASRQMAAHVATRLQEIYGGPVHVEQLDVGVSTVSVRGLELFEAGAPADAKPWAVFDQVETDISLWDLLHGEATPHHLTVTGAHLTLRFNKKGHLVTDIPTPKPGKPGAAVPDVRVENGLLTLAQDGHKALEISGVTAELKPENGQLVLGGTVDNPDWGHWTLRGQVDQKTSAGSARLTSDGRVQVTQAMLEGLPFVDEQVWKEVQLHGSTPGQIDVISDPATHAVHYRVKLTPDSTWVHVSSIDLTADEAHGSVVIDDGLIQLRGVQGRTAGGQLAVDADLDFMNTPSVMKFEAEARGLDVRRLPARWKLPESLEGKLTGKARVVIRLRKDGPETTGDGQGVIADARVAGFPAEPIDLHLRTGGQGLYFDVPNAQPKKSSARPSKGVVVAAAQVFGEPESETTLPVRGRVVSDVPADLGLVAQAPAERAPARDEKQPAMLTTRMASPTYLDVNLNLKDIDLQQAVRQARIELPFPVEGRGSVHVKVSIPINDGRNVNAYRLEGTATLPRFRMAGLELRDVEARIHYANGLVRLEELRGQVPAESGAAGAFHGTARMQLFPRGDFSATLDLERIPIARVMTLLPNAAPYAGGSVSGSVAVKAPADRIEDVAAWHATGKVRSDRARVYGLELRDVAADFRLDRGLAQLTSLLAKIEGATLTGSGDLVLTGAYRYRADVRFRNADLAALQRLAPQFRPPFPVAGVLDTSASAHGTVQPLTLQGSGTATARELRVSDIRARSLKVEWEGDTDRLRLRTIQADLYGGDVSGSATVPLQPSATGAIDLRFKGLDVGPITRDIPGLSVRLEGKADGKVQGSLGKATAGKARTFQGNTELQSSQLRVQGIPTERLHGNVNVHGGVVDYRFEGESLGGKFELDGQIPPAKSPRGSTQGRPSSPLSPVLGGEGPGVRGRGTLSVQEQPAGAGDAVPPSPLPLSPRVQGERGEGGSRTSHEEIVLVQAVQAAPPAEGHLRVRGALLSRIWEFLHVERSLGPLRGALDFTIAFQHLGPDRAPVGSGPFVLRNLRWGEDVISGSIQGEARLTENELRLNNLGGSVGQGLLRGQLAYNFKQPEASWFSIGLDNVELARALTPWPALAARIQGTSDLSLRGTMGREWRGTARVHLGRGRVLGVDVNDWRLPIDFTFAPSYGYADLEVYELNGQLAHGRVEGRVSLRLGTARRLEGQVRFYAVDVRTLLQQAGGLGQSGGGLLSGRFDFTAGDVRTLDDVTGLLTATLAQPAQAQAFPVLQQVIPFLGSGASSGTTFQSGDLRARLGGGVLRIERMTLSGPTLRLFIDGTVTLEGRLDLRVMANTNGNGIALNAGTLALIGLRLPAGPIPIFLIARASNYLANRLVHLRVVGTVRNPVVQVVVSPQLGEQPIRFFLGQ